MSRTSILALKPRSLKRAELAGIIVLSQIWQDEKMKEVAQKRMASEEVDPALFEKAVVLQGLKVGRLMHVQNLRWTLDNVMDCVKYA